MGRIIKNFVLNFSNGSIPRGPALPNVSWLDANRSCARPTLPHEVRTARHVTNSMFQPGRISPSRGIMPAQCSFFIFYALRKYLVLLIEQSRPVLSHLQYLYPYESVLIQSEILSEWYVRNSPRRPKPVVTKAMIQKWCVYRDEACAQQGRPPEGYRMSKKEEELLTYLLTMKQRLVIMDQIGTGLKTSFGLFSFVKLIIKLT